MRYPQLISKGAIIVNKIIQLLRKSKLLKRVREKTSETFINTNINEITPFNPRLTTCSDKRLNLLVPSINQEHMFGGIATAIKFFDKIAESGNFKKRIILTDAAPNSPDLARFSEYSFLRPEEDDTSDMQIVPFNDRYNKTIPIGKNDYFLATAWWTAYFVQRLSKWQSQEYNQPIKKLIYFIQDFEPGFYPWSSHYLLAESTYKYEGPQIAVFNTNLLKEFFNKEGYTFEHEYSFEPVLNERLQHYIENEQTSIKKKKQILIYGRPSVPRNAFTLIVEALKIWVWKQSDVCEWSIISAGEKHPIIDIGNGLKIYSKGKMSIEEYAETLAESSIGISLMVSPHPSYPPLEMASFGMKVITNSFANKDLSKVHTNVCSLDVCTPDRLALEIFRMCNGMDIESVKINKGNSIKLNQFDFIDRLLCDCGL